MLALTAITTSSFACQSREAPVQHTASARDTAQAPRTAASSPSADDSEEGLRAVTVGPLRADEQGGRLVVLLHGWGADGEDLVPLANVLAGPGVRCLVPEAPLVRAGGGRAWWHLDQGDRPAHVWNDELPPGYRPHRAVENARRAVQALIRSARKRYAPESVALVGFSQGGMLALDVALHDDPNVDRVAVLSGVLIADSLPALHAARAPHPRVFVSHGKFDPVLPFQGGESIRTILEPRGFTVTWLPFDGGHEIPRDVVAQLRTFVISQVD